MGHVQPPAKGVVPPPLPFPPPAALALCPLVRGVVAELALPTSHRYEGVDTAVDYVLKAVASLGPFDGLLGFSQGSNLATILIGLPPPPLPPLRHLPALLCSRALKPVKGGLKAMPSAAEPHIIRHCHQQSRLFPVPTLCIGQTDAPAHRQMGRQDVQRRPFWVHGTCCFYTRQAGWMRCCQSVGLFWATRCPVPCTLNPHPSHCFPSYVLSGGNSVALVKSLC